MDGVINGECITEMRQMRSGSVDMFLSDIPYGEVSNTLKGKPTGFGGLRKIDRGDADQCDIELCTMVDEAVRIVTGSFYVFCGTEQISTLVTQFKSHKLTTRVCAWEKSNPSPMNGSRLWLSGMEFCVFARKPKAIFNKHCEKALWKFPVGRSKNHPTEKPVKLMEYLIESSTNETDTVLDCTMGSGTTGVACQNLNRRFVGIELNPLYYLMALERLTQNGQA